MKIVFIGNFNVVFSTESHHLWTWRKLGIEVVPLQEDKTNRQEILDACSGAQCLQWTHTHSYPDVLSMDDVRTIHSMSVKTFSYHLDRYFGINGQDKREDKLSTHPSYHLDYFFSTDGGNDDKWVAKGINHFWLPPGVVEYGCYYGAPQPGIPPIIFAGSVGYHPEYPFRPRMVEALEKHYGTGFKAYQGIREADLNNLYASTRIIVGDHIFAGVGYYWSDRVPETLGRGGFLIHPRTQGLRIPGLAHYEPQNSDDLIRQIDFWLEHSETRKMHQQMAHEWVKSHDTYTHRLAKILRILGF